MSAGESPITRVAHARYARWDTIWGVVLYLMLLRLTGAMLTATERGWPARLGALLLIAACAGLAWPVMWRHPEWRTRVDRSAPLLLALVLIAALAGLVHGFLYIPFVLFACAYAFRYLPARWGILVSGAAIVLTTIVQVVPSLQSPAPESILLAIAHSAWLFFPILIVGWIAQLVRVSGERQRVIEELHATQGRLAAAEREAGVQEERGRLAREIHDTLAQGLVSIVMHLEAAEQALPPGAGAARQHLDQARRMARDNLAEARRFVWALQPEALERATLPTALAHVAERWSDEHGIPVAVSVTGEKYPLPPECEVTFLRAAQEALANVARHARAQQVNLTLSYMPDEVVLDVMTTAAASTSRAWRRSPGGLALAWRACASGPNGWEDACPSRARPAKARR
jgi:signal transduction histidine kinase